MARFNPEQFNNAQEVAKAAEYGTLKAGTHEVLIEGCSYTIVESKFDGVEKKEPAIEFTFTDDTSMCRSTLTQKFPTNDNQSQNFIAVLIQILAGCGMSNADATKLLQTLDEKNTTDEAFVEALNAAINKIAREQRVAYLLVRNILYNTSKSIKYGVIQTADYINKKYSVVPFISKIKDVVAFNPTAHDVSEEQLARQLARLNKTAKASSVPEVTTGEDSDLPF